MSLPANIRINARVPFPSLVQGAAYISLTKVNGIWTIAPNWTTLAQLSSISDPTLKEVIVYDIVSGQFNTVSLATLLTILSSNYRVVTSGTTVLSSDTTILVELASAAAINIVLPTSASRNGLPITVKDYNGTASGTYPITFVPASGETIDGFSASAAAANGIALIDVAYGRKTLNPLTSGGWFL